MEHPEPTLFHYTDQNGLMGILSSGELWATHSKFLNDSSEINFSFEKVQKIIRTEYLGESDDPYDFYEDEGLDDDIAEEDSPHKRVLEALIQELFSYRLHASIFIVCFSTEKDDLNQWRAYSGPGNGYAIGFDFVELKKRINGTRWNLNRCIYDNENQDAIIRGFVDAYLNEYTGHFPCYEKGQINENLPELLAKKWAREFTLKYAPFFKHECFISENEWRLILITSNEHDSYSQKSYKLRGADDIDPQIKFRSSDVSITPYMSFECGGWHVESRFNERPVCLIDEFTIRPHVEKDHMKRGFQMYLRSHNLSTVLVNKSKLPYRSF